MFRFNDLVRGQETVREIKQKYPETAVVFERFALRISCYDCSIEQAARKVGAPLDDVLVQVNEAIYRERGLTVA